MDTMFAPAKRAGQDTLDRQHALVAAVRHAGEILDAMSQVALLLNRERQIIYSNQAVLDLLGISHPEDIFGRRPGEAFNCVHAACQAGGCGTAEACRFCGAVNTILAAQNTGKPVTGECRLTVDRGGALASLDLRVTASPLPLGGDDFLLVTFLDISDEKRRKLLERIFFHDLLNTASVIDGLTQLLLQTGSDPASTREIVPLLSRGSSQLIEEIIAQRVLSQAEHGDLQVQSSAFDPRDLLSEVAAAFGHHLSARDRKVQVAADTASATLTTDPTLLRRVLSNLVKNALEAAAAGSTVTLGGRTGNGRYVFSVHNPESMPHDAQLQVFQRSFSTKGRNRGLGTYSVRLLVERYLKGRAGFTVNETGTTFTVDLPLLPEPPQ